MVQRGRAKRVKARQCRVRHSMEFGAVAQWESVSFATMRSRVQIPLAPLHAVKRGEASRVSAWCRIAQISKAKKINPCGRVDEAPACEAGLRRFESVQGYRSNAESGAAYLGPARLGLEAKWSSTRLISGR